MITTKEELSVVIPADWVPGPPQGSWTYEDYAALPADGRRYEIVNGKLPLPRSIFLSRSYPLIKYCQWLDRGGELLCDLADRCILHNTVVLMLGIRLHY